jgi:hypothetical protein
MNVERPRWLLPACADRWLPCAIAEAFTLEQPVPRDLQCMLEALEVPNAVRASPVMTELRH